MTTMRLLRSSVLLLALLAPALASAQEPGYVGAWRGQLAAEGREVAAELTVRPDGGGLALRFIARDPMEGQMGIEATLAPSGNPAVLEVQVAVRRGLFAMFERGSREPAPFDGTPLIWARRDGDGLIAYQLALADDGASLLLRLQLRPEAEGLATRLDAWRNGRGPVTAEGLLVHSS